MLVAQSYPTLCDPTDCGPPGSSVHGILQEGILEWTAEDLPYPEIELGSLELQADSLPSELQGRSSITEVSEKLNRKAG